MPFSSNKVLTHPAVWCNMIASNHVTHVYTGRFLSWKESEGKNCGTFRQRADKLAGGVITNDRQGAWPLFSCELKYKDKIDHETLLKGADDEEAIAKYATSKRDVWSGKR